MALRRPKPSQSFEPFWGCSQYPDCRGTRAVVEVNEDQLELWARPNNRVEADEANARGSGNSK